jgi:hypothetical protein
MVQLSTELAALKMQGGLEDLDLLNKKTKQLSSMLMMITGTGFETFEEYNDDIKSNYLWACSSLADEVNDISLRITLR